MSQSWCKITEVIQIVFLSSDSSKLDEDSLYMAYAGIMAKVLKYILTTVTTSLYTDNIIANEFWTYNASTFFPLCALFSELPWWRGGWRGGEEFRSRWSVCQSNVLSWPWLSCFRLKLCPVFVSKGEGDGEAEAVVSAGSAAWTRSCRNGATNHQRQQRWVCWVCATVVQCIDNQ